MAANFETGFSGNRIVPWHGLGTVIEGTLNSKDALRIAGLDWKVVQEKIYLKDGLEVPNSFANIRDKDRQVLGIVTERYRIVQNEEAFAFTDELIGGEVKYETAGSLRCGRIVWMLARLPETDILGDKVDPYLCFTNSFDRGSAVRAVITPIRVVCNNTLNLALKTAKRSWSYRHMGDIDNKIEDARRTLELTHIYMKQLSDYAEKLVAEKVSEAFIQKLLDKYYPIDTEQSNIMQKRIKDTRDAFMVCLEAEDIAQFKGTKWGVLNAVTDFSQHLVPNRTTKTFRENNFINIMNGKAFVDNVLEDLIAA